MSLETMGVVVITPAEEGCCPGIVTSSVGSVDRNVEPMQRLPDRKILVPVRYTPFVGGVRVSCHFFHSQADIEMLLASVGEILRAG